MAVGLTATLNHIPKTQVQFTATDLPKAHSFNPPRFEGMPSGARPGLEKNKQKQPTLVWDLTFLIGL